MKLGFTLFGFLLCQFVGLAMFAGNYPPNSLTWLELMGGGLPIGLLGAGFGFVVDVCRMPHKRPTPRA